MRAHGRMGQAPTAGDRAEVARRHDEAVAALERANQRLDDLETALVMRGIDYGRARESHNRMALQLREQVRRRAVDASPARLVEIERIGARYDAARDALAAAQEAWNRGSSDHAAFTARLRALHHARLLSALADAFPADAAAARLAGAWTDYALGRSGASKPSIFETVQVLGRAALATPPRKGAIKAPAQRGRPGGVPPAPPQIAPVPPPTPAGPTGAVWGPQLPPPWVFRLPATGIQVALPVT